MVIPGEDASTLIIQYPETRWLGCAGLGLAWRKAAFGNGFGVGIMKARLALGCLGVRLFFLVFIGVALVLVLESERASI